MVISDPQIHDTQSAQISQKQDGCNINVIMETMCLPGHHHNEFVATHIYIFCLSCIKYGVSCVTFFEFLAIALLEACQ